MSDAQDVNLAQLSPDEVQMLEALEQKFANKQGKPVILIAYQ